MSPSEYIALQPVERQPLLHELHAIILAQDKTITPVVEPMMGKDMIIYKGKGMMKYALSSVQKYMTLHVLPMYMFTEMYERYKKLLSQASFQKGCINFSNALEMPAEIVTQLISDSATIDLVKIREDQLKARKAAKKK